MLFLDDNVAVISRVTSLNSAYDCSPPGSHPAVLVVLRVVSEHSVAVFCCGRRHVTARLLASDLTRSALSWLYSVLFWGTVLLFPAVEASLNSAVMLHGVPNIRLCCSVWLYSVLFLSTVIPLLPWRDITQQRI
jgi:hypothetical protein